MLIRLPGKLITGSRETSLGILLLLPIIWGRFGKNKVKIKGSCNLDEMR